LAFLSQNKLSFISTRAFLELHTKNFELFDCKLARVAAMASYNYKHISTIR